MNDDALAMRDGSLSSETTLFRPEVLGGASVQLDGEVLMGIPRLWGVLVLGLCLGSALLMAVAVCIPFNKTYAAEGQIVAEAGRGAVGAAKPMAIVHAPASIARFVTPGQSATVAYAGQRKRARTAVVRSVSLGSEPPPNAPAAPGEEARGYRIELALKSFAGGPSDAAQSLPGSRVVARLPVGRTNIVSVILGHPTLLGAG